MSTRWLIGTARSVERHWERVGRGADSVWSLPTGLPRNELGPYLLDRPEVVDCAVQARLLQAPFDGSLDGRLLVYVPEAALHWQLANMESDGLFDDTECPGWDLWLGWAPAGWCNWYRDALLVWVPRALVARADAGMAIDPQPPFAWIDHDDAREFLTGEAIRALRQVFEV